MRPKLLWPLIGTLLLVFATAVLAPLVWAFFASGDCVSSGGSYDYLAGRCDFSQNHPFIPLYRTWSFWLASAAGLTGFWAIGRRSVAHAA
jgi:hypothetical protein